MIEIRSVPLPFLDRVWAHFLPQIERGLSRGAGDSATAAQMKDAIRQGNFELWCVLGDSRDAVAVLALSIEQYPNKRTLHVHMAAGRGIARWLGTAVQHLEEYRALTGCDALEAVCRPGMARLLARNGWKEKATIMQFDKTRGAG